METPDTNASSMQQSEGKDFKGNNSHFDSEKFVKDATYKKADNEERIEEEYGTPPNDSKPNLDPESFYGRTDHRDILKKLLLEIKPVSFPDVIGLAHGDDLKQKHIVVAVVKQLLQTAKERNWNLCKAFEYTYIYNGAFWKQCDKEDIKKFLAEAAVKMGMPHYDAVYYEFTEKLLKQFLSDAHLPAPHPDSDKILINLHNGTFEFTSDEWKQREFTPDDFLTYQLPFSYNVDATCPMFDEYLLRVLPDETSRMVLQEFAGYIFTNLNLEKFLVLIGRGGNGKSVFMNILCALIGKENILQYSLGLFNHEYNRAKLCNVLLNYSSEKGFDLKPDTFKALVSGEPVQAREIYQKPFTLYNRAKFATNCNELPKETESTEAYFRRFLIVRFDEKISEAERDISLANKIITSELPGVFNWMLIGLERLLAHGKGKEKFTYCEKSENALLEFCKQGDSTELFLEENHFTPGHLRKKPLNEIYDNYKCFCRDDGYRPLGKNNFSARLIVKGYERTRLNNGATAFWIDEIEEII